MANPFNVMNPMNIGNNPNIQQLKQAYQIFSQSKNPLQAFQMMASRNPQLQSIMQMLQNGGNPQQIFNSICQQRGINPQEFLKQITG